MSCNIVYRTDAIAEHFSRHRRTWDEFYPSERFVFDRIGTERNISGRDGFGHVLDVGCAAGGLAAALPQRFGVASYTGVDINAQAIAAARQAQDIGIEAVFHEGDITGRTDLPAAAYDTVFNLSCADWNVDFRGILAATWRHVAPGGTMILSLRMTDGGSVTDMSESFQYIQFSGTEPSETAERAAYIVLNITEALGLLGELDPAPERMLAYGYWGRPSAMARTPFGRILFSVVALRRPDDDGQQAAAGPPRLELHLPWTAWRKS
jgi:SAM-dependent methyltransferase